MRILSNYKDLVNSILDNEFHKLTWKFHEDAFYVTMKGITHRVPREEIDDRKSNDFTGKKGSGAFYDTMIVWLARIE